MKQIPQHTDKSLGLCQEANDKSHAGAKLLANMQSVKLSVFLKEKQHKLLRHKKINDADV